MAQKGILTTADYLSMEDFTRLVDGLHTDKMYVWELFCCLSFCTALRGSDVLSLNWIDILEKDILIKIEHKTGKNRQIPFNSSVKEKISELYLLHEKPDKNLPAIRSNQLETPYSLEYVNRMLKKFRVEYRLPKMSISSHTFRKTFGRHVYESSGRTAESLILLNSIFKHSSIDITKVYIGLRQDEINSVFNAISF